MKEEQVQQQNQWNKIGTARVYMHNLSDATYSNASTEHDLYVFDVQTFTDLTVNVTLVL